MSLPNIETVEKIVNQALETSRNSTNIISKGNDTTHSTVKIRLKKIQNIDTNESKPNSKSTISTSFLSSPSSTPDSILLLERSDDSNVYNHLSNKISPKLKLKLGSTNSKLFMPWYNIARGALQLVDNHMSDNTRTLINIAYNALHNHNMKKQESLSRNLTCSVHFLYEQSKPHESLSGFMAMNYIHFVRCVYGSKKVALLSSDTQNAIYNGKCFIGGYEAMIQQADRYWKKRGKSSIEKWSSIQKTQESKRSKEIKTKHLFHESIKKQNKQSIEILAKPKVHKHHKYLISLPIVKNKEISKSIKIPKRKYDTLSTQLPQKVILETAKEFINQREKHGNYLNIIDTNIINDTTSGLINQDHCETCNGTGALICCDTCPKSFHWLCLDPPLIKSEILSKASDIHEQNVNGTVNGGGDSWYCNSCSTTFKIVTQGFSDEQKNVSVNDSQSNTSLLFQELRHRTSMMNPKCFCLPSSIKRTFESVSWDQSSGDYINTREDYCLSNSLSIFDNLASIENQSLNKKERQDDKKELKLSLPQTRGKSEWSFLCQECGKSALRGSLIQCDFCPFSWHLDCLYPPLTCFPSHNRKWICPAHAEHFLPYSQHRQPRRRRNMQKILTHDPYVLHHGSMEVLIEKSHTLPEPNTERICNVSYSIPESSLVRGFVDRVLTENGDVLLSELNYLAELANFVRDSIDSNVKPRVKYVDSCIETKDLATRTKI